MYQSKNHQACGKVVLTGVMAYMSWGPSHDTRALVGPMCRVLYLTDTDFGFRCQPETTGRKRAIFDRVQRTRG